MMGLRVGIITVLILHFLLGLALSGEVDVGGYFVDLSDSILDNPLNLLTIFLLLLTTVIAAGAFIMEVRWRLRALSAASVFTSSRQHANTIGIFYSIGILLAVWIVQLFALTMALGLTVGLLIPIDRWIFYDTYGDEVAFGLALTMFISVVSIVVFIYLTYHEITALWLNKAVHRLIDRGGASVPRRYHPQRAYNVVFGLFIVFWSFYALGTVYEANNPIYQFDFNELPIIYNAGLMVIAVGLALSVTFRLSLDFTTLLATKPSPRAQYMNNQSRVGRELNLLLGVRIGVLCAGVLHYLLGMKIMEELTLTNTLLGLALFSVLLALQIGEVGWSQVSLRRLGQAIESRIQRSLIQILLIYLVILLGWILYASLLCVLIVGVRYSPLFSTFTTQADVASGLLLFILTISMLFGGLIFGVHRVIQRSLR